MKYPFFACAALLLAACGSRPAGSPAASESRTEVVCGAEIALAIPAPTGGASVDEALWYRTSSRDFADAPLSLEELSGVVWAAAGINRPESGRRTAPSALALYPIRTYVFLAGGVYRYDATEHRLVRVAEGDRRALSGRQPFVAQAAANLVFVADLAAYADREGIAAEHVRYLCGQDAACCVENANLYASGHGLKAVTRGSAPEAELLELLGLDPARYFFALALSVGR